MALITYFCEKTFSVLTVMKTNRKQNGCQNSSLFQKQYSSQARSNIWTSSSRVWIIIEIKCYSKAWDVLVLAVLFKAWCLVIFNLDDYTLFFYHIRFKIECTKYCYKYWFVISQKCSDYFSYLHQQVWEAEIHCIKSYWNYQRLWQKRI